MYVCMFISMKVVSVCLFICCMKVSSSYSLLSACVKNNPRFAHSIKKKLKNITRMIYKIKTSNNINILHTIKNCMKYNILNYTHTLWDIWEHMQINYTQRNFNKIHEFKISKLKIGRKYHLTIDFCFVLIPKRH